MKTEHKAKRLLSFIVAVLLIFSAIKIGCGSVASAAEYIDTTEGETDEFYEIFYMNNDLDAIGGVPNTIANINEKVIISSGEGLTNSDPSKKLIAGGGGSTNRNFGNRIIMVTSLCLVFICVVLSYIRRRIWRKKV